MVKLANEIVVSGTLFFEKMEKEKNLPATATYRTLSEGIREEMLLALYEGREHLVL